MNEIRLFLKAVIFEHDKKESLVTVIASDKKYIDRVVLTAGPEYLAKFTTTPQIIIYQRRFLNAGNGQNDFYEQ